MNGGCWAGLDGCRRGWVLALLDADGTLRWSVRPSFLDALEVAVGADAQAVGVDMPIGLPLDRYRPADRQARTLLGARRSTVFPTPVRAVLDAATYGDALCRSRRACGVGLSKQAWNLVPKIAEVDRVVTRDDEAFIYEVHPELAFGRLAGEVLAEPKKTPAGRQRRTELIAGAVNMPVGALGARLAVRTAGAAADDVLDAAAVALSARTLTEGRGTTLGDGVRDVLGRLMRICF